MKKLLFIVLAAMLVLSACPGRRDGDVVTLQVLWFSDGDEGITFQRLADRYSAENPHIRFELIEVPFADLEARLRMMITGRVPPAIVRHTNASIGAFVDHLVDLGQYVTAGPAFANQFNEGLRFMFDGRILGAPKDLTANGLVYNRTAFRQAGISVPQNANEIWTWDQWRDVMRQVVANSDVRYGLVFDRTTHRFATLLYQAGGSFLTPDLSMPNINTPQTRRAVTFFQGLHQEGLIPAEVWLGAEDPNSLFRSGQIAMHFAGSWMVANYRDTITDFEWGFAYLPREVHRSSVPGGKYLTAIQGSGVEREAALFIEWMSRPDINADFVLENNFISQIVGNEALDYEFGSDFFAIFASDLAASPPAPGAEWGFPAFTGRINLPFRDALVEVLGGVISVDTFLQEMHALFTEALADIAREG